MCCYACSGLRHAGVLRWQCQLVKMYEGQWTSNRELGYKVPKGGSSPTILEPHGHLINFGVSVPTAQFKFKILHGSCLFPIDWPKNTQRNNNTQNRDLWSLKKHHHLRVAVACILKCRMNSFLAFFAIKCASWTSINAGTSNRSPCASIGFDEYASVSCSNAMLERTLLTNNYGCLEGGPINDDRAWWIIIGIMRPFFHIRIKKSGNIDLHIAYLQSMLTNG